MKNKLMCLVMVLMLLPLSFVFCGCKYKTYEFYGIIGKDNKTIIPYEEITDEVDKAKLSLYEDSTIKLKSDNTYTRTIVSKVSTQVDAFYTFSESGRYELEDKSLVFIVTLTNGKEHQNQQQFVDGKIIYYDSDYLLVYV